METQKRESILPGSLLKEFKGEANVHKIEREREGVISKQKWREHFRMWVKSDENYMVCLRNSKWFNS